ncbi:uncharacterized protein DNG_03167 [Cephalotrichum gorgonifer]|uniref:Zn(2)-C6 fungal-type domain-containing protein n=1 Tax=Cephalotrichum gorgonifer TaxID=2041049 RepID=A0AAE8STZ7_9PEZI|nr:uncharacterized protein DNG_03167 [Cephalotrichum gorgonifer]
MIQSVAHNEDRRPGKRPAARGTAFYPRKRANTACQVCRARKTKCDNRKPACSYCLSVGATCIQSSVDLSSFDPASLKILERLDDLERLMRNTRNGDSIETLEDAPLSPSETTRRSTVQCEVSTNVVVPTQTDISLRSILPEKLESLLQWPAFSKYTPPQAMMQSPRIPSNSSPPTDTTLGRLLDMNMHEINGLLDSFFIHVHCKNPIFDEISTRRLVITVILEGIDWSANSCLALIICALGKISTPFGPNSIDTSPGSPAYNESQCLFHAAQRRIGVLLCETDIIGTQCLFLSGVYAMCIFQPFHAWRFFSQALAACQNLPFLRRAYNMPELPASASATGAEGGADETREQAVYWSAWKSERELRRELVLPDFDLPQANLYPPFFPTPPQLLGTMDSARQRSSWLFYLAEISLNRLYSRVCSEVSALHASSTSDSAFLDSLARMVPEHEAQLHQWSDNLPPEFSVRTVPEENDDACGFVLRGHFVNLFETLSWPFVMAHITRVQAGGISPEWEWRLAEEGLRVHLRRICVNEPGFRYRHHGTWFMVRTVARSAMVLLAAGLLGCEMPRRWRGAVEQVVELLGFWEEEMPELAGWKGFMQQILMDIAE